MATVLETPQIRPDFIADATYRGRVGELRAADLKLATRIAYCERSIPSCLPLVELTVDYC